MKYAIISEIEIIERRIPYDVDKLLLDFQNSCLFRAAPVWSSIIIKELKDGLEYAMLFLNFVNEYAKNKRPRASVYNPDMGRSI